MSVITVPGAAFAEAFASVVAAVERRSSYPLLACVRIAAGEGELEIVGTDTDVEIHATLEAEGDLEPVCIPADRLAAAIGRLKGRDEIALEVGDGTAKLSAGRSRFTIPTMSAEAWPFLTEIGEATQLTVPGAGFARLFAALQPAICNEETRYYLGGVMLERGAVNDPQRKDCLLAAATNGHVLYVRHLVLSEIGDWGRATVPRKTCALLAKLCAPHETVGVTIGETKVQVRAGSVTLLGKLIQGTYPDWRRVAPVRAPQLAYDTAHLIAAAETASAGVTESKTGKPVRLVFGTDETAIEAKDLTTPQLTARDACPHQTLDKVPIEAIGINAVLLTEMLERLDAETAEISLGDVMEPVAITGATFDDRRVIIMPYRV